MSAAAYARQLFKLTRVSYLRQYQANETVALEVEGGIRV